MIDVLRLPVRRLQPEGILPAAAHPGDAGLDLASVVDAEVAPGERAMIPTGLALAIPEGYAGLVLPRSGLASREGLTLANAPGLIDSGYRGEIRVVLLNTDARETFVAEPGDRIAQLVILQVPQVAVAEVGELPGSDRGARGFGSSQAVR
jgi:dUTP pyrophosphatase